MRRSNTIREKGSVSGACYLHLVESVVRSSAPTQRIGAYGKAAAGARTARTQGRITTAAATLDYAQ